MELKKNLDAGARPIREVTHKLKAWREHLGLSAAALADKAGMTGSFVSLLESGRAGYTQNSLEKLADAMNLEPWQILAQDPRKPIFTSNFDVEVEQWAKLVEEERKEALRVAEHAHQALCMLVALHVADLIAKKERRR